MNPTSEMEDLGTSGTSLFFTQRIKRHVKDKKTSKVNKLNTSLASKIKNKIINNSSILKISLKHNNRALAQALSIEKENSRKLTTEKMLLHKEVEKLNFRNAFLRQKLNHLHKILLEIEAFVSSNLISAIEMTGHPEDYQSPSLLPTSQKKGIGNQLDLLHHSFEREIPHIRPTHLPMRVLLTSADDDDGDFKEAFQYGNSFTTKKVPDSLTPVASKVSEANELHLEFLQSSEKNNQEIDTQDDPERIFSATNSTENQTHLEQSSKRSSASGLNTVQCVRQEKKKRSRSSSQSGNVTERKKRLPSWESSNFPAAIPLAVDLEQIVVSNTVLNQSSKINDNPIDTETKTQKNEWVHLDTQLQSANDLNAELPAVVPPSDEQQLYKTVYEADMDLTESEISKIVTVQTGAKNRSNNKTTNVSENKAFRKVKDSSTEKNRIKSKLKAMTNSYLSSEERGKDTEESHSLLLTDSSKSVDQKLTLEAKLAQSNTSKNIMFQKVSEQNVVQISQHHDKKNKVRKTYVVNDEERISLFPPTSSKFHQDNNCAMGHSFQTFDKGRDVRRTFVVHNSDKEACFPSQKNNETVSGKLENLENELQTGLSYTKGSQNLSNLRTQNLLRIEKQIMNVQPSKQSIANLSKKSLKYTRKEKTHELLSEVNQLLENNDKVVFHKENPVANFTSETHTPEKNSKCQMNSIKNASCAEVISKKLENYDQCLDIEKLDKKYHKSSSGRPTNLLRKSKPKTLMQPADLTQSSVPLDSSLKCSMRELDSDPENQNELQKSQTQSTTITLNKKPCLISFMKGTAEHELYVKMPNKRRDSNSKRTRKTYVVAPIDQNEVKEKILETVEERLMPCHPEQVNQEENVENEKIVKLKPDRLICDPEMENSSHDLASLTQIDSFNTRQFSPFTILKGSLLSLDIPIAKEKLPDNVTLKEHILQLADTEQKCSFQEKTKKTLSQVSRRTETIGKDTKILQDLTNASFISRNSSPKSESAMDEVSSDLPTKRKRVAVCYKEPSLARKLRRDEFANSDFPNSKPKKSKGRKKKEDKKSPQEIL